MDMDNNVINTLRDGEKVTSTYAETYFDDNYCDYKKASSSGAHDKLELKTSNDNDEANVWVSPSDLLIGIIELNPPFTSKITRGKTHEGILGIGNEVLAVERAKFMKYMATLIAQNDAAWNHILTHEKALVSEKVQKIYSKIFTYKSNTMAKEISTFYEHTLQELEMNLKTQVGEVLMSTHASIIGKLNTDVKNKLKEEKLLLERILQERYDSEVLKIKKYYKLLLNNEVLRINELINKTIIERNDALRAFYRQIEAENISSTMYVMCTERKKCRIKKFILQNYQTLELKEKYQKIKAKQDIIDVFKEREVHISEINKEWEDKIKKILKLFLKFVSFSLKLLPEQASFLLNFEKMVVLQLNEMQNKPFQETSILIDAEQLENTFDFEKIGEEKDECSNEPFVLVGDLTDTPPPSYGSRETLPHDVDLPTVKITDTALQRQLVYAKCHQYEDIKAKLEAERCKCMDNIQIKSPVETASNISKHSTCSEIEDTNESITTESSYEHLLLDDFHRINDCPNRNCQDWFRQSTFPYLNSYLDFDDEKYKTVQTLLGNPLEIGVSPKQINPKHMVHKELPFSITKEPYHTVETQYSSQEDLNAFEFKCTCIENYIAEKHSSTHRVTETPSKILLEHMTKRKISLRRLLQQNSNLLKIFTDESFDIQY